MLLLLFLGVLRDSLRVLSVLGPSSTQRWRPVGSRARRDDSPTRGLQMVSGVLGGRGVLLGCGGLYCGQAAQVLVALVHGVTACSSASVFQVCAVFLFFLLGSLLRYGREFGVVWVFLAVSRVQAR